MESSVNFFCRVWHDIPVLVLVSMLAYFCFLEQLLVKVSFLLIGVSTCLLYLIVELLRIGSCTFTIIISRLPMSHNLITCGVNLDYWLRRTFENNYSCLHHIYLPNKEGGLAATDTISWFYYNSFHLQKIKHDSNYDKLKLSPLSCHHGLNG